MRGVFTASRSKSQCQDAQSYSPTAPGNDRQRILQLSMRTEKRLVFTLGKVLELDAAFPSDQRTPLSISRLRSQSGSWPQTPRPLASWFSRFGLTSKRQFISETPFQPERTCPRWLASVSSPVGMPSFIGQRRERCDGGIATRRR